MQSVSSRIWTRVAVSISYDDNNYTTGTSKDQIWHLQRPDLAIVIKKKKKKRMYQILDWLKIKENEKRDKYFYFIRELKKLWNIKEKRSLTKVCVHC